MSIIEAGRSGVLIQRGQSSYYVADNDMLTFLREAEIAGRLGHIRSVTESTLLNVFQSFADNSPPRTLTGNPAIRDVFQFFSGLLGPEIKRDEPIVYSQSEVIVFRYSLGGAILTSRVDYNGGQVFSVNVSNGVSTVKTLLIAHDTQDLSHLQPMMGHPWVYTWTDQSRQAIRATTQDNSRSEMIFTTDRMVTIPTFHPTPEKRFGLPQKVDLWTAGWIAGQIK